MRSAFGVEHTFSKKFTGYQPTDKVGRTSDPNVVAEWKKQGLQVDSGTKGGQTSYARRGYHPRVETRSGLLRRKRKKTDTSQVKYKLAEGS